MSDENVQRLTLPSEGDKVLVSAMVMRHNPWDSESGNPISCMVHIDGYNPMYEIEVPLSAIANTASEERLQSALATSNAEIDKLATVICDEFGGPDYDVSACEMAVRLLRRMAPNAAHTSAPAEVEAALEAMDDAISEAHYERVRSSGPAGANQDTSVARDALATLRAALVISGTIRG
jgi:hypothetical protein